ncbi:NAD(P)-binding domain-containing protein [Cynara cardunculus var. scolymus]|uniref:(+)-lariciresinol reductase n=1 Tax=Cynara cardunculus var. scolymus TaxID=59895 RepID=A0A118JU96_CYNCS|nr:NAD(P)-binding domain-containing protein [Cynara cardunculus var. scolymus]
MRLKVLIIGGTGYIGKRLVKANIVVDVEKVQILLSFKKQGARLVIGSFNDHCSLVKAVKQVDVVICAISGRFLPSEFGMDPARMADAMEPGRVAFDDKMVVRKAIEDAGIPFMYRFLPSEFGIDPARMGEIMEP